MRHETAIAVIEALGDTLIAKDAFTDTLKEHISFLSDANERLRKDMGELIGRDDEKIKAECEEIAKGECACGCTPCSEPTERFYYYGDYETVPEEGLTAQLLTDTLHKAAEVIGEINADTKVKNFEVFVTKETIAWQLTTKEPIEEWGEKEFGKEAEV